MFAYYESGSHSLPGNHAKIPSPSSVSQGYQISIKLRYKERTLTNIKHFDLDIFGKFYNLRRVHVEGTKIEIV